MNRSSSLRYSVLFVFLLVSGAALVVIMNSIDNLRYQGFHAQHVIADNLTRQIDRQLGEVLQREASRPATDYEFMVVGGDRYVQRSPLSSLQPDVYLPGVIGFFQLSADNYITTPLLPQVGETSAFSDEELETRRQREAQLKQLLKETEASLEIEEVVVTAKMAPKRKAAPTQESNYASRLDDLKLDTTFSEALDTPSVASAPAEQAIVRQANRAIPQAEATAADGQSPMEERISAVISDVEPLVLGTLGAEHLVAYRRVYSDGETRVQGAVIEREPFLEAFFLAPYAASTLSQSADLVIALDDVVIANFQPSVSARTASAPEEITGTVLLRSRLSAPGHGFEVVFSAAELPLGAGLGTVILSAFVLFGALIIGSWLMLRVGKRQMELAAQQQDFIAAVSHELKTPITSIRMYGEILQAGWADEDKKQQYYQFIYQESDRLGRLVNNVLQLARFNRADAQDTVLEKFSASDLMKQVEERSASLFAASEHSAAFSWPDQAAEAEINVDQDAFLQIMLNLIDNAIKFSSGADNKTVDVTCVLEGSQVVFKVRDYGPGIDDAQRRKIFQMFYRAENELTRETVGTGIGLALVRRLASAIHAEVDVANGDPGAEFRVALSQAPT